MLRQRMKYIALEHDIISSFVWAGVYAVEIFGSGTKCLLYFAFLCGICDW